MISTAARVPAHTAADINRKIRQETINSLAYFIDKPGEIPRRLNELDKEWDIERTIEANDLPPIFQTTYSWKILI